MSKKINRFLSLIIVLVLLASTIITPAYGYTVPEQYSPEVVNTYEPDAQDSEPFLAATEEIESNINNLVFANPYNLPATPHGGSMLHVWNMSFNEIINHLPQIAEAGFNTIQTSPIGRSITSGTAARRWYGLYQPTHFEIGNWLGSEAEFRAMTRAAAQHGIHVIVDAIPNHTTSTASQVDPALRNHQPPIFHDQVFPSYARNISNWDSRQEFVRARLLGLLDFYTGSPHMQNLYMDFLGSIIDAGAAGFRYDAAHHIELPCDNILFPGYGSDYWPNITKFVDQRVESQGRIPFQYGEVLGSGDRQNQYIQALPGFLVSSYAHSGHILGSVRTGRLTDGQSGWNSNNFFLTGSPDGRTDLDNLSGSAKRAVPWVECHDHYGNEGVTRNVTDNQIAIGWALINTRADTTPLFFMRPGSGFTNDGNMFVGNVGTTATNAYGFSTFYRNPVIAAINWFSNDYHGQPEKTSTHGTVAMVQRGPVSNYTGVALVNVGGEAVDVAFPVQMPNGNYVCRISGDAFTVNDGWLFGPAITSHSIRVIRAVTDGAGVQNLVVSAYPGTSDHGNPAATFTAANGVDVNLISLNATVSNYTVSRNGETITPYTAFQHNTSINIGAGAQIGDVFVLTVTGTNNTANATQTFFYLKGDPEAGPELIRLEFFGPAAWTGVGIWSWPLNVASGSWPGTNNRFTRASASDPWVFYVPHGFDIGGQTFTIMNAATGSGQTPDISGVSQNSRITWTGSGSVSVVPLGRFVPPLPQNIVLSAARDAANNIIGFALENNSNAVRSNISLPNAFTYMGTSFNISWSSSNAQIINPATGAVTRPEYGQGDASVELTAVFMHPANQTLTVPRTYNITVIQDISPEELHVLRTQTEIARNAANSAALLSFAGDDSAAAVTGNITLPSTFVFGGLTYPVSWGSNNEAVIEVSGTSGIVRRPPFGSGNTSVDLVATLTHPHSTLATATSTPFTVTVIQDVDPLLVLRQTQLNAAVSASSGIIQFTIGNNTQYVTKDINLPTAFSHSGRLFEVSWDSAASAVVNAETGAVVRPAFGENNETVHLTASFVHPENNELTAIRVFTVTVFAERKEPSVVNELVFSNPHGLPETPHGGNILHAWNMSFNEIRKQLPYIAESGFGVIQTSPIGSSAYQWPAEMQYPHGDVVGNPNGPVGTWWMLYQPTGFNIGNMLGTEAEFRALTREAAELGIYIIVDAVPNHATAFWHLIDDEIRRPELYHAAPPGASEHNRQWDGPITNWGTGTANREHVTRRRLAHLTDFYTGNPEFQGIYMDFLGRIIDAGASGFRYDATRHIEHPGDAVGVRSDFWPNITGFVDNKVENLDRIPFQYGEVLGGALPYFQNTDLKLTPHGFSSHIRTNAITRTTNNLTTGNNGWDSATFQYAAGLANRVIPWVESHDDFGNDGVSRGLNNQQIILGWALISARAETSPLFLVRPGGNFDNDGQMFVRAPNGSYRNAYGHTDLYRDPAVAAINWFSNDFIDYPERTSTHNSSIAMIERGPLGAFTGAVVANTRTGSQTINIPTQLVAGNYSCQITGNTYTVADGRLTGPAIAGRSLAVLRVMIPEPRINVSEGSTEFVNPEGIEIIISTVHTDSQTYTVSLGNEVIVPETEFNAFGTSIVIGTDADPGDVFTLTIRAVGRNSSTIVRTFNYVKADPDARIRVEFVQPAWNQARIWAWSDTENMFNGVWDNAPRMTREYESWVFTFPADTPLPFYVSFHNGSGQSETAAGQGFRITGDTRIQNGVARPLPTGPAVSATPGTVDWLDPIGQITSAAGINVMLITLNSTSQYYTLTRNGVTVIENEPFTRGQQINIGAGAAAGDIFVLTLTGTDGIRTSTESFIYTRTAAADRIRFEFITDQNLTGVGVWTWPVNVATGSWPGTNNRFVWDASIEAWVFTFPAGHPTSGQGATLPFWRGTTQQGQTTDFSYSGSTRIFWINGVLTTEPIIQQLPAPPPEIVMQLVSSAAHDLLTLADSDRENRVTSNVILPSSMAFGGFVFPAVWTSSHPSVIDPETGEVIRPVFEDGNAMVTLTVTFSNPDHPELTSTRSFYLTVLAKARITYAEILREAAPGILKNGLSTSQLILSSNNKATLTLIIGDREIILAEKVNNRNVSGMVILPDGSGILEFDIKGNGSNVKIFRVIS